MPFLSCSLNIAIDNNHIILSFVLSLGCARIDFGVGRVGKKSLIIQSFLERSQKPVVSPS